MTYTTFNGTGIKDLLIFPSIDTPITFPLILLGLWVILTSSSFFYKRDLTGSADFMESASGSSFVLIVFSGFLRYAGYINSELLVQSLVLNILIIVGFMLTSNKR